MASQGGRKRKASQYEKECKDEFCSQMTGNAAIKFVSSLEESKLTIKQFLNLRANKTEMLPTFLLLEKLAVALHGFRNIQTLKEHIYFICTISRHDAKTPELIRLLRGDEFEGPNPLPGSVADEDIGIAELYRLLGAAEAGDESITVRLLSSLSVATLEKFVEAVSGLREQTKQHPPRGRASLKVDELYPLFKHFVGARARKPTIVNMLPILKQFRAGPGIEVAGQSHAYEWFAFEEHVQMPFYDRHPAVLAWLECDVGMMDEHYIGTKHYAP